MASSTDRATAAALERLRNGTAAQLRACLLVMGAAESRGVRNEDKRTSRREHAKPFTAAIKEWRAAHRESHAGTDAACAPAAAKSGLHVCLRKRPMFKHERVAGDFDAVTCTGTSEVVVHDARSACDTRQCLCPLLIVLCRQDETRLVYNVLAAPHLSL